MDADQHSPMLFPKVARRARRLRAAALGIAYGGTLIGTLFILTIFLWVLLPAQSHWNKLRAAWSITTRFDYSADTGYPIPHEVIAAHMAALAPVQAGWSLWWRRYAACIAPGRLFFIASLAIALFLWNRASKATLVPLIAKEVREGLATTLLTPEAILGPSLFHLESARFIPVLLIQFAVLLVARAAVGIPKILSPDVFGPEPFEGLWHDLAEHSLTFAVFFAIPVYVLWFWLPYLAAVRVRLACRPRSGGRVTDPALRRIPLEAAGQLFILSAFALPTAITIVTEIGSVITGWRLLINGSHVGTAFLRSHPFFGVTLGFDCFVWGFHRAALADQRRKALEEYFRFE